MGKKIQKRCLFCARVFDADAPVDVSLELTGEVPRTKSICPMCEARINKEAGDTMKEPKPM
jgi:hypothetical protein